jgi:hypothetical protein
MRFRETNGDAVEQKHAVDGASPPLMLGVDV